jgi:hypothetical protein
MGMARFKVTSFLLMLINSFKNTFRLIGKYIAYRNATTNLQPKPNADLETAVSAKSIH